MITPKKSQEKDLDKAPHGSGSAALVQSFRSERTSLVPDEVVVEDIESDSELVL